MENKPAISFAVRLKKQITHLRAIDRWPSPYSLLPRQVAKLVFSVEKWRDVMNSQP